MNATSVKKYTKSIILGALCVSLGVFLLTGCGDTKSEKPAAPAEKVLTAGTNAAYPPFEFTKEGGELQGFDIDLMNEIGKRMGYTVKWKNMGFDGLIPAITSGQLDAAIAGMNITEERQKVVAFSDPYYAAANEIVFMKDKGGITSIKDLEGKTIAVEIASTAAALAHKIPNAKVKEMDNVPDILNELKAGGSDASIIDAPVVSYYMKQEEGKFATAPIDQKQYKIGIAMNKDKKELVQQVNKALKDIHDDGTFKKLEIKWFGHSTQDK